MGKHTVLQLTEGRSGAFGVTHGFKPAGKAGGCYGTQARYRNLWNQELGSSVLLCGGKVMVTGTEAILLSSSPKQTFLKSSKCLSGSLESILSQYHRLPELEGNLEIFQSKPVSI